MKLKFLMSILVVLVAISAQANSVNTNPVNQKNGWSPDNEFYATIDFADADFNYEQTLSCDDFNLVGAKITVMGNVDQDFSLSLDPALKVKAITPIKLDGKSATLIEIDGFGSMGGTVEMIQKTNPGNKATLLFDQAC